MHKDFWVFGYGSLMWRPDFAYREARRATLFGWHRSMCILSTRYRGVPGDPGLVLGLDRGGSCHGVAFLIKPEDETAVRAALEEREMLNNVYIPREGKLHLDDGRTVIGFFYTARRDAKAYAGHLAPKEAALLIRQGNGTKGSSHDYLRNTVHHLEGLGLNDTALAALLRLVERG